MTDPSPMIHQVLLHQNKSSYCRLLDSSGQGIIANPDGSLPISSSTALDMNLLVGGMQIQPGQSPMSQSLSVTLPSDMGTLAVSDSSIIECNTGSVTISSRPPLTNLDVVTCEQNTRPVYGTNNNLWDFANVQVGTNEHSASLDCQYASQITLFGNCGTDQPNLTVQVSQDDVNFHDSYDTVIPNSGNIFHQFQTGARYVRVRCDSDVLSMSLTACAKA